MKTISVYTRGFTHAASYYRILQYTEQISDAKITNRFTVTEKMYRRYTDAPNLLNKIKYHLMIFFRNLANFAADMVSRPDTVVISRAAVPKVCFFPLSFMYEHVLKHSKVIWDFDDDIFGINEITRNEARLLQKYSDKIIVTSEYLKNMLNKKCRDKVCLLPTTDGDLIADEKTCLESPRMKSYDKCVNILWVGASSGLKHVNNVVGALDKAAEKVKAETGKPVTLTVICNLPLKYDAKHLKIRNIRWSRDIVRDEMLKAHIGIMPLLNIKRSMGKGGFKLVQYMSAGLPAIASAIGYNENVVADGKTGYLIDDTENTDCWADAVLELASDRAKWEKFSRASAEKWEEDFSFERNLDFWRKNLTE